MHRFAKTLSLAVLFLAVGATPLAHAQTFAPSAVIFEDVRIFNGTTAGSRAPSNVLVAGNVIRTISSAPIADPAGTTVLRIRGGGRTLMPGLIDNHWHTMLARRRRCRLIDGDLGYLNLLAGVRGRSHADARLHHGARPGRAVVRAEARHRRGPGRRPAHLSRRAP